MTTISPKLRQFQASLPEWGAILFGMLVLFVPTLYDLMTGLWAKEEQAHGPIILALSLWLLARRWSEMRAKSAAPRHCGWGWPVLAAALLFYVVGRAIKIAPLEIGSFILLMAAILLLKYGVDGLKLQWFPFFFMLFMIPLPGPLVAAVTLPMKQAVSYVAEHLLFLFDYPVARSGVTLQIGQYQLLVADACAGLQTLLTLEALGLFYLNVVRHTSAFRNIALALLIVPISFTANVIRVCVLTLVTYYLGDAAGQGFLHGFAGMVLFLSALTLILGVDTLLQFIVNFGGRKAAPPHRSGNAA
ncbi:MULTISPECIES: exosortase B [unclassified Janthinobacterium]|uniref:exosortase B n=1 Tax=unclassified Janthinobacterium TaxID=2610881 RepID=UPI00034856D0|nr:MULTISPECIES: exosortase B [unclassified Janthinobacterium]MEC5163523.1 exosortase B [Janthinobacterium sp. CG_S6]